MTETVIVVEDTTSAAADTVDDADVSDGSDVASVPTADETTSSNLDEAAPEDRQEPPQEA